MMRHSGSNDSASRVERALEGNLKVADRASVVDDSVDPPTFEVAAVSKDGLGAVTASPSGDLAWSD